MLRNAIVALCAVAIMACGSARTEQPAPVTPEPIAAPVQAPPQPAEPTGRVEILWDTWGVPHVYAQDETALFWAFGWAQMESHGDLLLRLYGQARGRAAEYWGETWLDSDRWVVTNGIPARATSWMANQSPYMRAYLEAFALGINAYATANPERIDESFKAVLPVQAEDVLAHIQRVVHFAFVTSTSGIEGAIGAWRRTAPGARQGSGAAPNGATGNGASTGVRSKADSSVPLSLGPIGDRLLDTDADAPIGGSNGWAIAPSRSASGNALLLANPHLPWGDLFTWYEAHLVSPGLNAYGAGLVGFPLPAIAFNESLGWTNTVNTIDAADLYELTLVDDGYAWDGGERPFDSDTHRIRVLQPDSTFREETLTVRSSVHGPVVAQRGDRALALRVAGLDNNRIVDQSWFMLRARNMGEFEAVLGNLDIPMFTVIYADREGHILHVFNGQVPVRPGGDWRSWAGIVRGDTSSTMWTAVHAYHELPRVADPASGWLQNANDPPWTTTFPLALRSQDFPPYFAPDGPLGFRPQRSARMLAEDTAIAFEEVQAYKHSTHVESADHIMEDLVLAARAFGGDRARRAAQVLEAWDRSMDADSRGAVLYAEFFRAFSQRRWSGGSAFDIAWMASSPFSTPDGLAEPEAAAALLEEAATAVESKWGSLDIAWGDVNRLRRDGIDLPANGGPGAPGVFRVMGFEEAADGRNVANFGDSFVAVVEFGPTVRAAALLGYGNASQPGSPHRTDQLPLLARKQLRPVWFTRPEIEAHLEKRERY